MELNNFLSQSAYFGLFLSIFCYWVATKIAKKFPYTICNPLLLSTIMVIGILVLCHISYDTYNSSAKYLTYLLTPATVCLAVPMYRQIEVLKTHLIAIITSIFSGCIACAITIFGLSYLLKIEPEIYYSLLPKSVTTAIAIGVANEAGGNETITIAVVVLTGLLGAIFARSICNLFKITHPVAVGLACGNSAHAMGTSKAIEFGEIEGAMSSLAVVVAGIMTVIIVPIVAPLIR